jgi:hypothetical protein
MSEVKTNGVVDVFQKFFDSRMAEVHTMLPGKIVSYDEGTKRAVVQPLIKLKKAVNGEILNLEIPPINNVPVMFWATQGFLLKFPIKKDDGCAIFFAESGIGNFLNGRGDIVNPDDLSRFSLTDAVCVPGLWGSNFPSISPTIEFTEGGQLNLLGGTEAFVRGDSLETLLNNFLGILAGIVPGDPAANAVALTAIKTAATTAQGALATIKSTTIKGE